MLSLATWLVFPVFLPPVTHGCSESIMGLKLTGHLYKSFHEGDLFECFYACQREQPCQSFNYLYTSAICELNNRTMEAREQHVIGNAESVYFGNTVRIPIGSSLQLPALSCREIKDFEHAVSGRYWIWEFGSPVEVYCNMTTAERVDCLSNPCLNNGTCAYQGDDAFTCVCAVGYTGDICELAPECQNYTNLTDATRHVDKQGGAACDDQIPKRWYRFVGPAGTRLSESSLNPTTCGTRRPGWMKGTHPSMRDGDVTRTVCFSWAGNPCFGATVDIRVRNCGEFYVYELVPTVPCSRYCGADA
ncbi:predicted protein [Nematostella vectensis]|uniref:Uncharacterized protein n=1 Tax=Nematostella vectensis TaxID=45351 RepID=A7S3L4_NEMVE|nr:neurogenic locus notch homolog protein 1 [Nematostella vectensis]EDO41794.1 predicted protein [Nematostella vectensis]|eukprot:XP_001633857.1 predicted protein [Nematostella vectensis]